MNHPDRKDFSLLPGIIMEKLARAQLFHQA
jgi:hypothetical protein